MMKVTDTAKELLLGILKENSLDVVAVSLEEMDDGSVNLNVQLVKKEDVRMDLSFEVNGVTFVMTEDVREALQDIIFDVHEGELVFHFEEDECCHHHHGDGECCHHHHHEEGCCCGEEKDDCCCCNE